MAKLVDAPGLGPDAYCRRVGSSPIPRTRVHFVRFLLTVQPIAHKMPKTIRMVSDNHFVLSEVETVISPSSNG